MLKWDSQKGFTLIELLLVVTIIGILAATAMPMYLDHRNRAFNAAAQSDSKHLKTCMEAYYADNKSYPLF